MCATFANVAPGAGPFTSRLLLARSKYQVSSIRREYAGLPNTDWPDSFSERDPGLHSIPTGGVRNGRSSISSTTGIPADDGLGLKDNQCGSPIRPQPGQPNPQQAVSGVQTNAVAAVRLLQNQELMAQGQNFSLQSCPSSEIAGHGEKQGGEEGKNDFGSLRAAGSQVRQSQLARTLS
jgi:hypothetical protein